MDFTGINFMGAAVGILAVICTLVLLFGRSGTRKILGWSLGLAILGTAGGVAAAWVIDHNKQAEQAKQEQAEQAKQARRESARKYCYGGNAPEAVKQQCYITQTTEGFAPQARLLSDAEVGLAPNNTAVTAPPFDPSKPWLNDPIIAPAPQPARDNTAVTAPPHFDPSKPYEVGGPPAAPTGLYEQLAAAEDQEIAWTNSHAPIKLHGPIKLTHASRVERLITMEYEITFPADKWTDDHRSDLTRITTTENCEDSTTRKMLDAGFRVTHVFRDQSGLLTYSITITKYNCSQASN
jgi:hypothetical protein